MDTFRSGCRAGSAGIVGFTFLVGSRSIHEKVDLSLLRVKVGNSRQSSSSITLTNRGETRVDHAEDRLGDREGTDTGVLLHIGNRIGASRVYDNCIEESDASPFGFLISPFPIPRRLP